MTRRDADGFGRLMSGEEAARDGGFPARAGLYFAHSMAADCADNRLLVAPGALLYVGCSANLLRRARQHHEGPSYVSSFRVTIGLLLRVHLGLQVHHNDRGWAIHFGDGEARLTAWLMRHVGWSFCCCEQPKPVEQAFIRLLRPPCNINDLRGTPAAKLLIAERRAAAKRHPYGKSGG